MLVDIHSHLIPGVDDGAIDIANTLDLGRAAVADGVTDVILTPHHRNGRYINPKATVLKEYENLQSIYDEAKINLKLYPAQEIRITEDLLEELYNDNLLSLDGQGRYYLIEFPTMSIPAFAFTIIEDLISQGITPVIAHPERNQVFNSDYRELYRYIEAGCLSQITTSSYVGHYGEQLQNISRDMIQLNLAHVLATDVHNLDYRPNNLTQAYQQLATDFDSQKVTDFQANAEAILQGQDVVRLPIEEPTSPSKKKNWFNWFKK